MAPCRQGGSSLSFPHPLHTPTAVQHSQGTRKLWDIAGEVAATEIHVLLHAAVEPAEPVCEGDPQMTTRYLTNDNFPEAAVAAIILNVYIR